MKLRPIFEIIRCGKTVVKLERKPDERLHTKTMDVSRSCDNRGTVLVRGNHAGVVLHSDRVLR